RLEDAGVADDLAQRRRPLVAGLVQPGVVAAQADAVGQLEDARPAPAVSALVTEEEGAAPVGVGDVRDDGRARLVPDGDELAVRALGWLGGAVELARVGQEVVVLAPSQRLERLAEGDFDGALVLPAPRLPLPLLGQPGAAGRVAAERPLRVAGA